MKKRLATFSKANIGTQTKKPTQKQKFNISPLVFAFAPV